MEVEMRLALISFLLIARVANADWLRNSAAKAGDFEVAWESSEKEIYKLAKEKNGKDRKYFIEREVEGVNHSKASNEPTFNLLEQHLRVLVAKAKKIEGANLCNPRAKVIVKADGKEILNVEICVERLDKEQVSWLNEWLDKMKTASK